MKEVGWRQGRREIHGWAEEEKKSVFIIRMGIEIKKAVQKNGKEC